MGDKPTFLGTNHLVEEAQGAACLVARGEQPPENADLPEARGVRGRFDEAFEALQLALPVKSHTSVALMRENSHQHMRL